MIGFNASDTGRQFSFKYWLVLSSGKQKLICIIDANYACDFWLQLFYVSLTQHLDSVKQIVQSQFQSANFIVDFSIRYIVKYMTVRLIQLRFCEHCNFHIFYREQKLNCD